MDAQVFERQAMPAAVVESDFEQARGLVQFDLGGSNDRLCHGEFTREMPAKRALFAGTGIRHIAVMVTNL
jgi:hypothetical protein